MEITLAWNSISVHLNRTIIKSLQTYAKKFINYTLKCCVERSENTNSVAVERSLLLILNKKSPFVIKFTTLSQATLH